MWVQWDIERYSISYNWTSVLDNDTWREYVMWENDLVVDWRIDIVRDWVRDLLTLEDYIWEIQSQESS